MADSYEKIVTHLEGSLADYAMKSFDSRTFVDGGELFAYYNNLWKKDSENFKLINRTPIQHQRDRILYSNGVRKQSERYHILYRGGQRVIRNYITHTMRMMQVARTICRALKLNEDFAEAIVLGSKVGALPFIHASKSRVSKWVKDRIQDYDSHEEQYASKGSKSIGLGIPDKDYLPNYPEWIRRIKNNKVKALVEEYIPFAAGLDVEEAYSSGKQGYWLLTTNPYTHESQGYTFTPELMYGIWRHSLDAPFGKDTFLHRQKVIKASNEYHTIEWGDVSYESIVVQYADDITWVIENLNDSNNAALLNNPQNKGLFQELFDQGNYEPLMVIQGLSRRDSGKLYSYFINDFINYSKSVLEKKDGLESKLLLKDGDKEFLIGLSAEGKEILKSFKEFLSKKVFSENRVSHRKQMLETITEGCMDLIYNGKDEYLYRYIEVKANIEGWTDEQKKLALSLLDNDIHRIQLSVNVFSELGDQEVFSFVGMDSF